MRIGESLLSLAVLSSTSDTFSPVSGLMSVTIFSKIREILTYQQVTPVPNAHPCVEGIFMPRDTMMTVIDLKKCLGMETYEKKGLFIITNFNKLNIAFHVDEVIGIHRV